jgi:hypothetical protein
MLCPLLGDFLVWCWTDLVTYIVQLQLKIWWWHSTLTRVPYYCKYMLLCRLANLHQQILFVLLALSSISMLILWKSMNHFFRCKSAVFQSLLLLWYGHHYHSPFPNLFSSSYRLIFCHLLPGCWLCCWWWACFAYGVWHNNCSRQRDLWADRTQGDFLL